MEASRSPVSFEPAGVGLEEAGSSAEVLALLRDPEIIARIEETDGPISLQELAVLIDEHHPEMEAPQAEELLGALALSLKEGGVVVELLLEAEEEATQVWDEATAEAATTDALQLFLKEVGKHPLLTQVEEVELARQKDRYVNYRPNNKELEELKKLNHRERELVLEQRFAQQMEKLSVQERRAVLQGKLAFDKLINSNLRLVVHIAKNYRNQGLPFLDLIQEGILGLTRAVEKFDWQKGFKFSTYATWWIRQAVARGIADKSRTIRFPVHVVERTNKLERFKRRFYLQYQRDPTDEEVASGTQIPLKQVKEIAHAARAATSLNRPVGLDDDGEFGDLFADNTNPEPPEVVEDILRREALSAGLSKLTDQERTVVILRHGLDGKDKRTLQEIGRQMDLTRERIRQIAVGALRKLADMEEIQGLRAES